MTEIKGPAIDPEAFRVEGHCCGIRIPALQELTDKGLDWQFGPDTNPTPVAQEHAPAGKAPEPPQKG